MLKACIYFINKFILIIFYKKDSLKKKNQLLVCLKCQLSNFNKNYLIFFI